MVLKRISIFRKFSYINVIYIGAYGEVRSLTISYQKFIIIETNNFSQKLQNIK